MMNRETQILNQLGKHPNIITLQSHFYSNSPARIQGEPIPASATQTTASTNGGKKYLNLIVDFMPFNLSKYN